MRLFALPKQRANIGVPSEEKFSKIPVTEQGDVNLNRRTQSWREKYLRGWQKGVFTGTSLALLFHLFNAGTELF